MRATTQQVSKRALSAALKTSGLTKTEVANRVGVSKSALSNWLSYHRNPTPANLARLAEVLSVEVAYLKRSATAADTQ